MSLRSVLVILLALVCGGSAAIGINNLRSNADAATPKPVEEFDVVVAADDIGRGRTLTANSLTTRKYPKDLVPSGSFTKVEEVLERTVYIPMVRDEPVLDAKLANKKNGRGLEALVPDGMRACTITATMNSAVAGLINPGNHVDVLLSLQSNAQNDQTGGGSTTTLLEDIEVLTVDTRIEAPADFNKVDPNLRVVTLIVTPNQAARLELGDKRGTIHLTLRNPNDHKPSNARPATLSGIQFSQDSPDKAKTAAVPTSVASTTSIRTLRGTAEGAVQVEETPQKAGTDAQAKKP